MKSLKKQLMAAIAMTLVAAIAMGSSTYAWFVNNKRVEANGMKVQAQAESGVEISLKEGEQTWASTASAGMDSAVSLYPTSTSTGKVGAAVTANSEWWHAKGEKSSSKTALKDSYGILKLDPATGKDGTGTNAKQYFLLKTFQIRSTSGEEAKDLKITSVSVEAPKTPKSASLNKALRVGIQWNNGTAEKWQIYSPNGDVTYNVWDGSSTTGPSVAVTAMTGAEAEAKQLTLWSSLTSAKDVNVYIWFEGEDTELKSGNLPVENNVDPDELVVTIKFAAKEDTTA